MAFFKKLLAKEEPQPRKKTQAEIFGELGETPKELKPLGKLASSKFGAGKAQYKIVMESMHGGVEQYYYWFLNTLRHHGFFGQRFSGENGYIEKIRDLFTAGETSAYWGATEQRKGAQQDKFSQYMATVGKMVKDSFQIIRELRIIDERLDYYNGYNKGDDPSSVALKSIWIDMVEGASKNPSSVYGLAMQVGFAILPDLFFKIHPKTKEDVDKEVKKLGKNINRKVKEVLARKLAQFLIWKERTEYEIRTRRKFVLKYLRQHFNVIKLYMNWLRPYLRNIRRLQMEGTATDVDIAKAFNTSKAELEILAVRKTYEQELYYGHMEQRKYKKYFPCVLVKFKYLALPQMAYQEEYQRGAIHLGRSEIEIEGRIATKEEIDAYKIQEEEEDLELLSSVNAAMEALKEDLIKYLIEAGELIEEEKKPKQKFDNPFAEVVKGFKELFTFGSSSDKAEGKLTSKRLYEESSAASREAKSASYAIYKVFKQAHKMLYE